MNDTEKHSKFIANVYKNQGRCLQQDKEILHIPVEYNEKSINIEWCIKYCPLSKVRISNSERICWPSDAYSEATKYINEHPIDFVEEFI